MKKKLIVGMLMIMGGGFFLFLQKSKAISPVVIPEVTVYETDEISPIKKHIFGATIKNTNEVVLSSQVNGIVENILVREGALVKRGQVLVKIKADEYRAQFNQAQISLKKIQEEEKLARRKWSDLKPEARAQYKLESQRLEALVQESQVYLSKLKITAPFDGIISSKFTSEGAGVSTGTNLLRMVGSRAEKEIVFDISTELSKEILVGDRVNISSGNKNEEVKVSAIDPVADLQTRKIKIHAQLSNESNFDLGEFVNVIILVNLKKEGVRVPLESVVHYYDDNFIFLITKDNEVKIQKIEVLSIESSWVVISGIDKGENVVASGAQNIFNGDRVKIISETK